MYKDKRIAIAIPAYNVRNQIGEVIRSIRDFVDHIIVVDDASQDNTYEACKNLDDKRLIVLRNPENLGVGGATITGFRMAMKLDADIVVKLDGDSQMDALQGNWIWGLSVVEGSNGWCSGHNWDGDAGRASVSRGF
jgi:glycosyltransferase involved in cell wall biosynthesis